MVLGVLSDTHLSVAGSRLVDILEGPLRDAEILLHAGDFTGEAVADHLQYGDPRPFYGVAGNMDVAWAEGRLPPRRVLQLGDWRVGLIHGWGAPAGLADRVRGAFEEDLDLLVFGHAHHPATVRLGSTLVVNPGSAWANRGSSGASVARIDLGGDLPAVQFLQVPP